MKLELCEAQLRELGTTLYGQQFQHGSESENANSQGSNRITHLKTALGRISFRNIRVTVGSPSKSSLSRISFFVNKRIWYNYD